MPSLGALRTAVVGVSGYAGGELARLLLAHPRLQGTPPLLLGRATGDVPNEVVWLQELHPQLARHHGSLGQQIVPFHWRAIEEAGIELVFLALPHQASRHQVPEWLAKGVRVIDLSGAWRLHDPHNRAVYKLHDEDTDVAQALQAEAVYGCPELHRAEIASARLIANPGCYSTSIILALAPLLRARLIDLERGIVCDAKSGVSGAGKSLSETTHFMQVADNLSAYAVFGHRHTSELLEQLNLSEEQIQFTPHLLPIPRGILSTIYLHLRERTSSEVIQTCLCTFYETSPMVRVHATPALPQIQHVAHTSFCDLGFNLAPDGKRLVLVSCLDNLLKGASGQAIQNMNVMCGWSEEEGLQ